MPSTTIFISHFHADHIFGLPFFILEANYVTKRTQPLTIVGPPGLKTRFPELMECAFPGTGGMALNFELTLQELKIGTRNDVGSVGVTPSHVVHDDRAGPCLGFRFEAEGKVLAFSGDTEWTEALIDVGREADLFICEAYTRDKPITTPHGAVAARAAPRPDPAEAPRAHPYERRHAEAPRRSCPTKLRKTARSSRYNDPAYCTALAVKRRFVWQLTRAVRLNRGSRVRLRRIGRRPAPYPAGRRRLCRRAPRRPF